MLRVVVLAALCVWRLSEAGPVVSIAGLGNVEGVLTASVDGGHPISSFLGIPYGSPPTGDQRFKPAAAAPGWDGVLDASKSGPVCPQPPRFTSAFTPSGEGITATSSEDCLRLDVHARQTEPGTLLPVVVFLHGGALSIGGSYSIKPEILLDQEMILVVPQFRLGPLGFLNLNTPDIPGNAALYDQHLALQWVQDHIEDFGGDKSRVTLAGHSTGAALASHHMLSPISTGLFQRIIIHGGSGTSHWGVEADPMSSARSFAKAVNCDPNGSTAEITACILGKSSEELMSAYSGEDGLLLSPSVQNSTSSLLPENKVFIREHTFDVLASYRYNSVPLMAGSNKHEGLLYLEYLYNSWLLPNNYVNDEEYLRYRLVNHIADSYEVPDSSGVLAEALSKRYLDQATLGNFAGMFDGLVDLCGSSFVKGNVYRVVQFNSVNSSSYLYSFNFFGKDHLLHHANTSPSKVGVIHGDELLYLFPQQDVQFDENQKKVSEIMASLWGNFIISGNPTPTESTNELPPWSPFTKDQDNYLIIDQNATAVLANNYRPQYTIARDDGLEETSP
ncbi:acetylcholinesterase-like [Ischnura elegans]|uniref:acetylcholinesterase-like n=1 Tax=Ischnura elegans TaxID=197161 RepID=UPI001ED89BB9|nr:acetylcholinesterase-like [Ischnura elegans]